MNAERLHAVAFAIQADLQATEAGANMKALRDHLQNQVSQPQQAAHQQNVSATLRSLSDALGQSATNRFSPAWMQVVDEIGASELVGDRLADRVMALFSRNQITPSVALDELTEIQQDLDELDDAVNQLVEGLQTLGIGAEELPPGACEIGVLVPREAVRNDLNEFGRELTRLHQILGPFAELSVGSRSGFEIRTISSSDLSVFLDMLPEVAACTAVAIERLVALYKHILEIRHLRNELAEKGVADKSLTGVDKHASEHMSEGVEVLIGELIDQYGSDLDEGRRNELRNELRHSLNGLANRIDRGYNLEVRATPVADVPDSADKEAAARAAAVARVVTAAENLEFLQTEGEPILSLPEPDDPSVSE